MKSIAACTIVIFFANTLLGQQNSGNYPNLFLNDQPSSPPNIYSSSASQNMSEEDNFLQQSENRMDQMHHSNQNMLKRDRKMIQEGYDANELYYNSTNSPPQPHDQNNSNYNQERLLRGSPRPDNPQK